MALKTFTINNGSANQALVTNGSGVLSFAAVGASAGQVIQVVTATDSTIRTSTSTTFVSGSNTLSLSITPSAAANKILILVSSSVKCNIESAFYTVFRGATDLGAASDKGFVHVYGGNVDAQYALGINYLDSPNTTSSTTYELRMRSNSGAQVAMNTENSKGSITLLEIKG